MTRNQNWRSLRNVDVENVDSEKGFFQKWEKIVHKAH